MNVILLGAIVKLMNLEEINWENIIRKNVKENFKDINIIAFKEGMNLISKKDRKTI